MKKKIDESVSSFHNEVFPSLLVISLISSAKLNPILDVRKKRYFVER